MAYSDIYTAATDPEHALRKQVTVAVHKAATDIRNEGSEAPNHVQRMAWSNLVLGSALGPQGMAAVMIWTVMENGQIAQNPSGAIDSDVQFVVNSLINQFAGE